METTNIIKMFNEEGLGLKEIAEKLGSSKSTIQRKLVAGGFQFNRKANKYEPIETTNNGILKPNETSNNETNVSHETINNGSNVSHETVNTETNVSHETVNIVNRTYGIPEDIDRALKIKCAIEGTKAIEVIRKALKDVIEQKYFDMK